MNENMKERGSGFYKTERIEGAGHLSIVRCLHVAKVQPHFVSSYGRSDEILDFSKHWKEI